MDKTSKTLLRAASIIQEDGWCQHTRKDGDGRHCIRGALLEAIYCTSYPKRFDPQRGLYRRCVDRIKIVLRLRGISAPEVAWNDNPRRKVSQITKALTQAAEVEATKP